VRTSIKAAFNKALAAALITDFHFHDARHTAITRLRFERRRGEAARPQTTPRHLEAFTVRWYLRFSEPKASCPKERDYAT
jgi:integrase